MLKKILVILVIAIISSQMVFAEEVVGTENIITDTGTETVDEILEESNRIIGEETAREAKLIRESIFGAEIRLLQLRKNVLRTTIMQEEIIIILEDRIDVTELEEILEELNLILEQLEEKDANDLSVEYFVGIKQDSLELTKNFREIVSDELTSEEKIRVREKVEENEELRTINTEIVQKIRMMNANRVKAQLQRMGSINDEIAGRIQTGLINAKEARNKLKQEFAKLDQNKMIEAKERIEESIKENIERGLEIRKNILENIVNQRKEILEERLTRLGEQLNQKQEQIKEKIMERQRIVEETRKDINDVFKAVEESSREIVQTALNIQNTVRNNTNTNRG
jgi:hypothetical protein